jgi:hypothetical protein
MITPQTNSVDRPYQQYSFAAGARQCPTWWASTDLFWGTKEIVALSIWAHHTDRWRSVNNAATCCKSVPQSPTGFSPVASVALYFGWSLAQPGIIVISYFSTSRPSALWWRVPMPIIYPIGVKRSDRAVLIVDVSGSLHFSKGIPLFSCPAGRGIVFSFWTLFYRSRYCIRRQESNEHVSMV